MLYRVYSSNRVRSSHDSYYRRSGVYRERTCLRA